MRLLILLPYCIFHSISHHIANIVPKTVAVVDVFVCVYCCVPGLAHVPIVASQWGEGRRLVQMPMTALRLPRQEPACNLIPRHSPSSPRIWICILLCCIPVSAPRRLHGRPQADLGPRWRSHIPISYPSLMSLNQDAIASRPDAAFRDSWWKQAGSVATHLSHSGSIRKQSTCQHRNNCVINDSIAIGGKFSFVGILYIPGLCIGTCSLKGRFWGRLDFLRK